MEKEKYSMKTVGKDTNQKNETQLSLENVAFAPSRGALCHRVLALQRGQDRTLKFAIFKALSGMGFGGMEVI